MKWGMGEGPFPNVVEQLMGRICGYSHPAHLDAEDPGTCAAFSPAGSAALPGSGEDAARPGTAHPTAGRLRSGTATIPAAGRAQPSAMCPTAVTSPRSSQRP